MPRSSARLVVVLGLLGWTGCLSAAPPAPVQPPAGTASPAAVPVAAPAPAPAPTYKNTIRWTTASEVDSFGFDVFRGTTEDGPFERLNAKPIAGAGTSDESHTYAYIDETIDPAREYYYYVESISIDGVRERFTPISRARAKLAPPPAPAP